ncbi:TonB-dependent receptor [Tellurirhabdus bombi]|uniref:TonB-dependent receptor n=1 Tax=Tellurirhabdus bombi TaxID=2907205 RepID=UPI001F3F2204|nr:TonB-dependent receptor [Tellurirhabdus bombi]
MKDRHIRGIVCLNALFSSKSARYLLWAGFWLSSLPLLAQTNQLTGKFTDKANQALIGVPITLISQTDTTVKQYMITDTAGVFLFTGLNQQAYQIRASYLGFLDFSRTVNVQQSIEDLGSLVLQENAKTLKEVTIVGQTPGAQQKGDTLQFNASAYKVNQDATTEDLVRKLPGITIENGTVKTQGENVQQVLVDGKPFFGDDPSVALRNLPAEVIDKIEVFDRLSDQSQFTGFNDGNTTKTINIVTRGDRQTGTFGRVYGGYGTNDAYSAGGNINFFKGARRLSIVGLSNNVNQQNFSSQDLLGVNSGGGGGGGRPGGGGGRGGGGGGGGFGGGGGNFQIGQQSGISRTNSIGLNFSDDWGKKVTFRGSYFFNNSNNRNSQFDYREYFLPGNNRQFYKSNSGSLSDNYNHRIDARIEYNINKRNSILITPRISFQNNNSNRTVDAATTLPDSVPLNTTASRYNSNGRGYTFGNNILFRHRFEKQGRSFSANLGTNLSNRRNTNFQFSENEYFGDTTYAEVIQQRTISTNPTYQFSGNLSYTEPLNKVSQLQFTYNTSYQYSDSERDTRQFNFETNQYDRPNLLLSNNFQNDYLTNRAAIGYNLRNQKIGFNADLSYQRADLISEQTYPRQNNVRATFDNFLPSANLDYRINTDNRVRVFYRTNTQAPSVTQLQNVIDNTNPLFLTAGNPDLKQSYNHNLFARYTFTKPQKSRSLFFLLGGSVTNNYIGNSTLISDGTATLPNDSIIGRGVQLSRPINLNGFYTMRSFVTYSMPLTFIKTNLSVNFGYNYSRTPSQINNQINYSKGSTFTQGISLNSNISQKIDFSVSYFMNYNDINNTIQSRSNSSYFSQTTSARLNWIFGPGFLFQTDINNQYYKSFEGNFNQRFTLWNAAFGKKFLKNQRGELKLAVFDLLKQNSSISQNLTDTYFQTTQSLVLQRYFMLTFTYTLRQFKGGSRNNNQEGENNRENFRERFRERGGFPGGGRPGGPGGGGPGDN